MIVECAEHYVLPPKISKQLSRRYEGQPREALVLSWKAQNRLQLRVKKLLGRRLQRNKAKVAVARELCGFIWALLRDLDCYKVVLSAQRHGSPTTAVSRCWQRIQRPKSPARSN